MIDVLIFSKNRPAQLDLLLQSIDRFAPRLYRSVSILKTWTSEAYLQGYVKTHRPNHLQMSERRPEHFEEKVRWWLNAPNRAAHISFLVDDDMFFRTAHLPLAFPFSPRLGDYDYPWALDGCAYRKEQILDRLPATFGNPTQLEAGMAEWTSATEPSRFESIHPCLVGLPLNRVSDSSNMPAGDTDPQEMNALFLDGYRIDLDAMVAKIDPDGGAHQYLDSVEWRG